MPEFVGRFSRALLVPKSLAGSHSEFYPNPIFYRPCIASVDKPGTTPVRIFTNTIKIISTPISHQIDSSVVEWRASDPEFVGSSLGTGTAVFIFFQSNTIKSYYMASKNKTKRQIYILKFQACFLYTELSLKVKL